MNKESQKKQILFFLNHPAHYHLFKHTIHKLKDIGYDILLVIVTKDVLEDLVKKEGWDYVNLFPKGRRFKGLLRLFGLPIFFCLTCIRLLKFIKLQDVRLMVGTERTIVYVGWLKRIAAIYVNEDDTAANWENYVTYPLANKVVMPQCCDQGKWESKKITYEGYHELAYLRPRYFRPCEEVVKQFNPQGERYFIIRLAELTASHDLGKRGIGDKVLLQLIEVLQKHGRVFINAERELHPDFEKYRLNIEPHQMHDALAFSDLYIGDSQTMAAEAAILGVPSIRFNDFVGRLSYLEELEKKYELTFGIKRRQPEKLLEKVEELLRMPNLKKHWKNKRKIMLIETEDVTEFFVDVFRIAAEKGGL